MGGHFLLQGIFPTQGSNLCLFCLLHWQAGSLPRPHSGSSVQEPGLIEVIRLVCTSVFWGQYPVFLLSSLRVLCWERLPWLRAGSGGMDSIYFSPDFPKGSWSGDSND